MGSNPTQDAPLTGFSLGWAGVGRMGEPICRNLLKGGARLTVFDPDATRMAVMAELGADTASSVAGLAAKADIVFSMVPDDAALLAVVTGEEGLASVDGAGPLVVDLSTVSPHASAEAARALEAKGMAYLRCPVSGSTASAASAQLSMFVSGPRNAFERLTPVFDAFSGQRMYVGEAEEARVFKLLINILAITMPALVGEAVAFGEKQGLQRADIVDAINQSVAGCGLTRYKADMLKSRDWTAMATVDLVSKDLDLVIEAAGREHIPLKFASLARALYARLQDEGDGGADFFKVSGWPEWQA